MMSSGHFTWGDGVWSRDPARSPQLLRYATHRARAGGGRATSDASRPWVLSGSSQNELVLSAPWTTQSKPTELQDALQAGDEADMFA